MRTLSQVFKAMASGDQNQPFEIYDLYLDSQTLHLAQYPENITFYDLAGDAQTYLAFPLEREPAIATSDLAINHITVKVANVDRGMSAYLAANDFRGRRIVIRKVFRDRLSSSGDAAIIFDGIMDSPYADERVCAIEAVERIATLNKECPGRWYQLLCNWKYGSTECGISKGGAVNSGDATVDSATDTIITDAAYPLVASGDNYWKDGILEMTAGTYDGEKRRIKSNDATAKTITLTLALGGAPTAGDSYTVWRNCDLTRYRCSGDFQNDANFGGFSTIPQQMVIR